MDEENEIHCISMSPAERFKKDRYCWMISIGFALLAFLLVYFRNQTPARIVDSARLLQGNPGELHYLPLGLSHFRSGKYILVFNAPLKKVLFYDKNQKPLLWMVNSLNSGTHQFDLNENLYISRIHLFLKGRNRNVENAYLRILFLPSIHVTTYIMIFFIISALSILAVFTMGFLITLIRKGFLPSIGRFKVALAAFLSLLTISLLSAAAQALFQYRLYLERLQKRPELLIYLLSVMVALVVVWKVSQKKQNKGLFFLLAVFVVLYLFPTHPFSVQLAGDAPYWEEIFSASRIRISLAEPLSSLCIYGVVKLIRSVSHSANSLLGLMVTAKISGLAYLIIILRLAREWFSDRKMQLFFFLLSASLPVSVFFVGYPEMAFYSIPFIMLFFLYATRYQKTEKGKYLIVAASSLFVAVLMHGSALALLPALFLLPFSKPSTENRLGTFMKSIALILPFLFWLMVVLYMKNHPIDGVLDSTSKGGLDGRPFVSWKVQPYHHFHESILFEPIYLKERGQFLLLSLCGWLPLLLFRRNMFSPNRIDFIIFIAALGQLMLFLFWGFDLRIKDFDLYMTTFVAASILLIRCLVHQFQERISLNIVIIALGFQFLPIGLMLLSSS